MGWKLPVRAMPKSDASLNAVWRKSNMQRLLIHVGLFISLALSSCAGIGAAPTETAVPPLRTPSPLPTQTPTPTPAPTETEPPPTATATSTPSPTPAPQPLLLRRFCGRDYVARAGEAIELFYGGWGVLGLDLAQQWATALTVDLTIDGSPVEGQQQPPAPDLPFNCSAEPDDVYFLYYRVVLPELGPGTHDVTVAFNALRALSDGSIIYGPGQIAVQTFRITVQ